MLPNVLLAPVHPDPLDLNTLYRDSLCRDSLYRDSLDLNQPCQDGSPVDLDDALADARRSHGAHGVVDLLVATLTDSRVRDDRDIDRYLDQLKSACRQTRRYREAIPVFDRIAELNPARRFEVAAELAVVHGHLGERTRGIALLEAAYSEQRRLAPALRCAEFCALGEIAATVLRHHALARAVAALRRAVTQAWSIVVASALPAAAHETRWREGATALGLAGTADVVSLDERRPRLVLVPTAAA